MLSASELREVFTFVISEITGATEEEVARGRKGEACVDAPGPDECHAAFAIRGLDPDEAMKTLLELWQLADHAGIQGFERIVPNIAIGMVAMVEAGMRIGHRNGLIEAGEMITVTEDAFDEEVVLLTDEQMHELAVEEDLDYEDYDGYDDLPF